MATFCHISGCVGIYRSEAIIPNAMVPTHEGLIFSLPDLLQKVERRGFSCGLPEHMRARQLLTALAAECATKEQYKNSLCTLLAKNRHQQEQFHEEFADWWDEVCTPGEKKKISPWQLLKRRISRYGVHLAVGGVILGVIVYLIAFWLPEYLRLPHASLTIKELLLRPGEERSLTLKLDKKTQFPIEFDEPRVEVEGKHQANDDVIKVIGPVKIDIGGTECKFSVRGVKTGVVIIRFKGRIRVHDRPGVSFLIVGNGEAASDEVVEKVVVQYPNPSPPPPPVDNKLHFVSDTFLHAPYRTSISREPITQLKLWLYAFGCVPLLAWATWRGRRIIVQNRFFKRKRLRQLGRRPLVHLQFPEPRVLARPEVLNRVAFSWRPSIPTAAERLDVERSVRTSIQNGGFFLPLTTRLRTRPHYLILVDQKSFRDLYVPLIREFIAGLAERGIKAASYTFRGSPDSCYTDVHSGKRLPFEQIASSHAGSRLLIFADIIALVDPVSQIPLPWLKDLGKLRKPALFSRRGDDLAIRNQTLAARMGLLVLPVHEEGLRFYGSFANELPALKWDHRETEINLPPEVFSESSIWSSYSPPPENQRNHLDRWLHFTLGIEGMLCFAACAVYPVLDRRLVWPLVNRLANRLRFREDPWSLVCRVTGLPWFRQGWIPDWLRQHLIKSLSTNEEKSIRAILDELLGLTDLTIDSKTERTERDTAAFPQDPIVASVLGGDLSVSIPRRLREALNQQRSRPWLSLACAAVLSASAFLAANSVSWTEEPQSPAIEPTILEHDGTVWSAELSSDGTRVVTASADKTARVWDARNGKELSRLLGHSDSVVSASFSADGMRVVTASADKTARVWDARSGKELSRLLHSDPVVSASFSSDGARVVTASADKTARVWDAGSGKELSRLLGHSDLVVSASFSTDSTRVVTASRDGTARLWEAATGKAIGVPMHHGGSVNSAQFSADGQLIVTASSDKTARVWEARGGRNLSLLRLGAAVYSASFNPDGSRVVTASGDATARIWDARSGKELSRLLGHGAAIISASFSPDGACVVTASRDDTVRVWDARTGQPLTAPLKHDDAVVSASFSYNGARVVSTSADKTAHVWELGFGSKQLTAALFLEDLNTLVAAKKGLGLWNARSGEELDQFVPLPDEIVELAHRLRNDSVVGATVGNQTLQWNLKRPDRKPDVLGSRTPPGVTASEKCLSRDGELLAELIQGANGDLRVEVSTAEGKFVTALEVPRSLTAKAVRLFRSNKKVVEKGGIADRLIGSFDFMEPGSAASTTYCCYLIAEGETVDADNQGSLFAIGRASGVLEVWNPSENRQIWASKAHEGAVSSVAISPDASMVATAGVDNSIEVHLAASGEVFARDDTFDGSLLDLKFSQDGHRLGAISQDGRVRIWGIPLDQVGVHDRLEQQARQVATALEKREETEDSRLASLRDELVTLANKMEPQAATEIAKGLAADLENPEETNPYRLWSLGDALVAMANKMEPQAAAEMANSLAATLEKQQGANSSRLSGLWWVVNAIKTHTPIENASAGKQPWDAAEFPQLRPEDCSERSKLRSLEHSIATIVWFVNNTHEVLSLYWADYNGQETSYGQIKPGDNMRMDTYFTHPWVVTRGDGTCLGVYRPLKRPGVAVIQ
jgi:WD40 repeat protein